MTGTALDADITLTRGGFQLVVEVAVATGGLVAVVGPNGAGKSTLLRVLAGLEPVEEGRVVLDGLIVDEPAAGTWVPPERRSVGAVFQRPLLIPHLSALDNVAFPLRAGGVRRGEARKQAAGWLERMGAGSCGGRRPATLSGGQAQRVALARALVRGPRVLLLDEPLAAVDAEGRAGFRRELRGCLEQFGGVRLMVTHDPAEALSFASQVIVIEGGRVTQAGAPAELRSRPATPYVAALVGVNTFAGNLRSGCVEIEGGAALVTASEGVTPSREVTAIVHPRAVSIHRERPQGSPRNVWEATVVGLFLHNGIVRVQLTGVVPLVSDLTPAAVSELGLAPGVGVWASVKATEVEVQ